MGRGGEEVEEEEVDASLFVPNLFLHKTDKIYDLYTVLLAYLGNITPESERRFSNQPVTSHHLKGVLEVVINCFPM